MRDYAVLMADLVKSRTYARSERDQVQHALDKVTDILNALFSGQLVKPVSFSAGDEVQGMFYRPSSAFLYYRLLRMVMGSYAFRAGIGVGSWDTMLENRGSSAQDGEAYHLARFAIERARDSKVYKLSILGKIRNGEKLDVLADHSMGILEARTKTQRDVALAVETLRPLLLGVNVCDAELLVDLARIHEEIERMKGDRETPALAAICQFGSLDSRRLVSPVFLDGYSFKSSGISGLSYELSSLSHMSRQGIDQGISRGRVVQERNAAVLFARTLDESIEGVR